MESAFWDRVVAGGHKVPDDKPLADLTAELTTMLGDTDPRRRDEIAYPTLATWVSEGVYDELLAGLGDGMTTGLTVGLGEDGTDTVFRRSFSALVLAECVERAATVDAVPDERVLRWGDRIAGWLVRERDLRGFVPTKGWAHAVAHGADAIGTLAMHRAMGRLELTVLLDVIGDRLLEPTTYRFLHGEDDRLAIATMRILRRDVLPLDVLEPWVARLASSAGTFGGAADRDPYVGAGNVQAYLRALHIQLALAADPPACRSDLLLTVIDHLKAANPHLLG
ncbi:MAG: DUF2785 domain-containing protein [Nocardioidaceae bacterium]|nr:DUF2785 domain-containing protein [Nocardioidaceae bacterium]NUS51768.1 DUF2785 domain-containing protein [Nocardioidaceae bacterium]